MNIMDRLNNIFLFIILIVIFFLPSFITANISFCFCLHKYLFGIDCPGCGMIRALHSIMHLNFIDAINYNYSVFALFPYLILELATPLYDNNKLYVFKNIVFKLFLFLLVFNYLLKIIKHLT